MSQLLSAYPSNALDLSVLSAAGPIAGAVTPTAVEFAVADVPVPPEALEYAVEWQLSPTSPVESS